MSLYPASIAPAIPKPAQVTPSAPAGNAGMAAPAGAGGTSSAWQGTATGAPNPNAAQRAPLGTSSAWQGTATGGPNPYAAQRAPVNTAPAGEGYGPGFGEQYGKSTIGQYGQPTSLEQFAQSQLTGDNPYYQRLQQQQSDQINQQMAARGHYNSGGALSALGNASAALNADQFQNMGNLLGQASNIGLNRQQLGFNQAQGVQQMQQQRTGQQFNDLSSLSQLGAGLYGGFFGQGGQLSGDAAIGGANAGANAAKLTGQGQQAFTNTLIDGAKTYAAS